ncbi:MAG: 3D domain-containing protein [Phycisphaeraceae bacterium]
MLANKNRYQSPRDRSALRPILLTAACGLMLIAAGGAMRLLPNDAADPAQAGKPLQPLIVLDEVEAAITPAPSSVVEDVPEFTPAGSEAEVEPAPVPALAPAAEPVPAAAPASSAAAFEPTIPLAGASFDREDLPTFDGRPIRPVQTITMLVTAYSPDAASCAPFADGITASGYSVHTNGGQMVAADTTTLPFGTILTIPGYNEGLPVPVLDRGGAIKGNRLDVLYPTHNAALQWGVQTLEVVIWDYAD